MFARILSASRRRMMVVTGVAALLVATSGIRAQQPQGQQPQQPPPAGGQPAGQQPAAQQPAQPAPYMPRPGRLAALTRLT